MPRIHKDLLQLDIKETTQFVLSLAKDLSTRANNQPAQKIMGNIGSQNHNTIPSYIHSDGCKFFKKKNYTLVRM